MRAAPVAAATGDSVPHPGGAEGRLDPGAALRGQTEGLPRAHGIISGELHMPGVVPERREAAACAERWPRGLRRRFAKPLCGLKPVPGVRIPPSPPELCSPMKIGGNICVLLVCY